MLRSLLACAVACAAAGFLLSQASQEPAPGYDDTPRLPGQEWRVHDKDRPRPPRVVPGDAPGAPPSDAVVLFDGDDLDAWKSLDGGEAQWKVADGVMQANLTGDVLTREEFGDCQLHLEWRTSETDSGSSQGMGNSGVYLMGRYEVQVLDSWENVTYADGQAAALYGQYPPLVNASRPPGEWQSYDIVFRAPRFDEDGALAEPARITVLHNGVLAHHDRALLGPTVHRSLPSYQPHPERGPLRLQDHGDPVQYRNVWIRPLEP